MKKAFSFVFVVMATIPVLPLLPIYAAFEIVFPKSRISKLVSEYIDWYSEAFEYAAKRLLK